MPSFFFEVSGVEVAYMGDSFKSGDFLVYFLELTRKTLGKLRKFQVVSPI